MTDCRRWRRVAAFTLIELLVVVAILALLLSLLTPALAQAKLLAKLTICRTNLHHARLGMALYEHDNRGHLFLFDNGTQDGPHEYKSRCGQPGNPVLALAEDRDGNELPYISDARLFWCPLSALRFEERFSRLAAGAGLGKYWGTYSWQYPHVGRDDDPDCDPNPNAWPGNGNHHNQMEVCSPESRDLLMADALHWDRLDYPEAAFTYVHFNVLVENGSARHVTDDPQEYLRYLYGPEGTPYR